MNATRIEWAFKTWNPVTGCPGPKISPGCEHCYAERMAKRLAGRYGYDKDDPFGIHQHDDRLLEPLRLKKPSRIFACSMGDLFHSGVFDFHAARVFAVMAMCQRHTFMLLTKRADRMHHFIANQRALVDREYSHIVKNWFNSPPSMKDTPWPLPNVWHGITVCNQAEADEKLDSLHYKRGVKYFLSLEPLLGPVTLEPRHGLGGCMGSAIQWVICGGETGPGARPMHPDWVYGLRDQCLDAGVPFFFKGWGDWTPNCDPMEYSRSPFELTFRDKMPPTTVYYVGKKHSGRLLDERTWDEVPE
jgi:protein gp37